MDTHDDSCTYTKLLWANLYVYSFTIPFDSRYDKVRDEKFGIHVLQHFELKPIVNL